MNVLDCETIDSTYLSLEYILGLDKAFLQAKFNEYNDLESYYEVSPNESRDGSELLFDMITGGKQIDEEFEICWFHLTRTKLPHTFNLGILPLGENIDSMWSFLYSLIQSSFSKEKWEEFRLKVLNDKNHSSSQFRHYAMLYHAKLDYPAQWGPHGMLVKEGAFRSKESRSVDYLRAPETIEDICICFQEETGINLLDIFHKETRPCIVKFSDKQSCSDCLIVAMYYLYQSYHGAELDPLTNTTFDGNGEGIPSERILKVEFPDYTF